FLDKNKEADLSCLIKLFLDATFLILPTRFDCTPIVLCEAASIGLPAIVSDTGGISSIITDEFNGLLMPYHSNGKDYAERIKKIVSDETKYQTMCVHSRNLYEEKFNWKKWADTLFGKIKPLLNKN
ncbi:MAG: glycosyltransferase family 4 protein, partial [Bacteroidota bacterium]